MGKCSVPDDIVLLFDYYTPESQKLWESFRRAGCDCLAVVIEADDFLPAGVLPVYDLLTRKGKEKGGDGKAKYYYEIKVPDNWTVNAGVGKPYGSITYQHKEKGRIYYFQSGKRYLVKAVEWFDRKGIVRFCDHYNRHGENYARTVYDPTGKRCGKSWFSPTGQERIVENFITGDIVLDDEGMIRYFRRKIDLMAYAFAKRGLEKSRIFYNSLSTPFFLINGLRHSAKRDVLFWQEPVGDEIPWNMRMILEGAVGRTGKILVQKRSAYNRLLELGARRDMIDRLGFIYSFERENGHRPEALICTNSDRIEHCHELVRALPRMRFHILAVTTMSEALMEMKAYDNVSLYPCAQADVVDALFQKCDFYFDINYGNEIASAVYKAFVHNQLIFGFEETVHNRDFMADIHLYPISDFVRMVSDVNVVMENRDLMKWHLEWQLEDAMAEKQETYAHIIEA